MLNNSNGLGGLDSLAVLSDILQIANYIENTKQTSNDNLLRELQKQNTEYLEILIQQNKEILERLNDVQRK